MRLEHIGIAVKSIDERLKVWRDVLGLQVDMVKDVPQEKVRVAVLTVGGLKIELLESLEEGSAISTFIEKRGEGLHHLCFEVDDIERILQEMKQRGIKLIDDVPRKGAYAKKIAFVHPKDMGGVLVELSQK